MNLSHCRPCIEWFPVLQTHSLCRWSYAILYCQSSSSSFKRSHQYIACDLLSRPRLHFANISGHSWGLEEQHCDKAEQLKCLRLIANISSHLCKMLWQQVVLLVCYEALNPVICRHMDLCRGPLLSLIHHKAILKSVSVSFAKCSESEIPSQE